MPTATGAIYRFKTARYWFHSQGWPHTRHRHNKQHIWYKNNGWATDLFGSLVDISWVVPSWRITTRSKYCEGRNQTKQKDAGLWCYLVWPSVIRHNHKPRDNCDIFGEGYDRCLRELVDKHAPIETKVARRPRSRSALWYNYECRLVKAAWRPRHDRWRKSTVQHTATAYRQWRHQSTVQQTVFKELTPITGMQLLTNVRTCAVCGKKWAHFFNLWLLQSASIQLRRLLLSSATRWIAYEKQLWMLCRRWSITE